MNSAFGIPTQLTVGQSLEEFAEGQADIGFLCGLLYTHVADQPTCPVELLAAPILQGERYQGKPIYFSDVIVRRETRYNSFDDLQGCRWAYNEPASHSGYNLVCYSLLERGKSPHYFGKTLKTGSHLASLQAVLEGRVDATALAERSYGKHAQSRPYTRHPDAVIGDCCNQPRDLGAMP